MFEGVQYQVDRLVNIDPQLHHANAEGSVAPNRRRDDVPTKSRGDLIGCDLAPAEGSRGEVPQWTLPRAWFVNTRCDEVLSLHAAVQGSIGRIEQATHYLRPGVIMLGHANHRTITRLYGQLTELIRHRHLQPVTLDAVFATSRATG